MMDRLYFTVNILWKNKEEINKVISGIKKEIDELNTNVPSVSEKEKSSLMESLETLKSRLRYIRDYFLNNVVFIRSDVGDAFLRDIAQKFVIACVEYIGQSLSLKEITEYIINFNIEKDYEKIEALRKYNNKDIDNVLNYPEKTKYSVFFTIKDIFQNYALLFNENDEYYSFDNVKGYEYKKEKIIDDIKKQIRNLPRLTKFCINDFLSKYELTDEEKEEYALELLKIVSIHFKRDNTVTAKEDKNYNKRLIRENISDILKTSKSYFYAYHSLEKFEVRISPKYMIIRNGIEYTIIDDSEFCLKAYNEFLSFVDQATEYKSSKPKKGHLTGVVVHVAWKRTIKDLFKPKHKLPNIDETKKYVLKIVKEYNK